MNLDPEVQRLLWAMILLLLYYTGKLLKSTKWVANTEIPKILGILGGIIGFIVFRDPQAIQIGLTTVGVHQLFKQEIKKGDK